MAVSYFNNIFSYFFHHIFFFCGTISRPWPPVVFPPSIHLCLLLLYEIPSCPTWSHHSLYSILPSSAWLISFSFLFRIFEVFWYHQFLNCHCSVIRLKRGQLIHLFIFLSFYNITSVKNVNGGDDKLKI